jgi:hypothetical protein
MKTLFLAVLILNRQEKNAHDQPVKLAMMIECTLIISTYNNNNTGNADTIFLIT